MHEKTRTIFLIGALLFFSSVIFSQTTSDSYFCTEYVQEGENYKSGHKNASCIKAAANGVPSAQYSVGMGYGYEGDHKKEEHYYRLAAEQGLISTYLGLAHVLISQGSLALKESIYWYQRFYESRVDGYGYAANIISNIYRKEGNMVEGKLRFGLCKETPSRDDCKY